MEFIQEIKDYYHYLKKYLYIIIGVYALIEIGLFIKIGTSNVLMFASSIFVTLFVICSLILMFKDFTTSSKVYAASIPIIPMVLYIMNRLHIAGLGETVYVAYFAIYLVSMIKEYKNGKIKLSRLKTKYKKLTIIYILLLILSIISSVISTHVFEAFKLVFLSMISMMVYSIGMLCYKDGKKDFYKGILVYLCLGVALSGIPDTIVTIYHLIAHSNNQHLYGVLGSNFMLGYTIMVMPFILLYAANKELSGKYNNLYKLLLLIEIVNFSTQKSRGILLALGMCILFVLIIDIKNWKKYILVSLIMVSCMTFNVMHRWDMEEIAVELKIDNLGNIAGTNAKIFSRLINQAKNRRPIWALAFKMINDHTYFGVGPGHFKYYYLQYGGNPKKMYIDAHNIILNLLTEFGLIFTITFMLSWIGTLLKSVIDIIKHRKRDFREFKWPGIIGMLCLLAYGNITGQSFMTSRDPISVVPAFVFTLVMILMIYSEGKSTN